ncbi:MAG TPA: YbaB/EbfC family nucleoid-associated protein [Croceibacterium sp.]|nr:YbaB/EbfC family nucleoid-associated protein [Solirubrobacterales bacterium]HYD25953.1 YbaB/EbfC family nucleoid-associated protein [Croceibacterium sp.]
MNMEEMMKKAQEAAEIIQKQMGEAQVKLDSLEVEGVSGGGLVRIRCTAKGRMLGVSIDDSLIVPEDKQILEDLITAAFNDARAKAEQASAREMQSIQQGMGLPPGLNLPGLG